MTGFSAQSTFFWCFSTTSISVVMRVLFGRPFFGLCMAESGQKLGTFVHGPITTVVDYFNQPAVTKNFHSQSNLPAGLPWTCPLVFPPYNWLFHEQRKLNLYQSNWSTWWVLDLPTSSYSTFIQYSMNESPESTLAYTPCALWANRHPNL